MFPTQLYILEYLIGLINNCARLNFRAAVQKKRIGFLYSGGEPSYRMNLDVQAVSLSLTERYASHWGVWEGLREICQNFHDGLLEDNTATGGGNQTLQFQMAPAGNPLEGGTPIEYMAYSNGQERGRLSYDRQTRRLSMINHKVSLLRKVLLLGYSQKANCKESVGQFGEGLKVGALALLRSGLALSMTTSKDHWQFSLELDPVFDERVLTVLVSGRQEGQPQECMSMLRLLPDDTLTVVEGVSGEDWSLLVSRLLFLSPPTKFVATPPGKLLLDERHAGKMYVKGIFVSDVEDAVAGLDLAHAKLDRDRVTTLKRSDIEYQLSSMWQHAVLQRPEDLLSQYFDMLSCPDPPADVRHATFFADEVIGHLLADHFFSVKGSSAVPVLNNIDGKLLNQLQSEVGASLVLCNAAVIDMMKKAGRLTSIEDLLGTAGRDAPPPKKYITYASLSRDHKDVILHAVALMRSGEFNISDAQVDIRDDLHAPATSQHPTTDLLGLAAVDTNNSRLCEMVNGRLEISSQLLSPVFVHSLSCHGDLKPCHLPIDNASDKDDPRGQCRCREAAIFWFAACAHQHSNDVPMEILARKCTAALAHQACGLSPPCCLEVHKTGIPVSSEIALDAQTREDSLRYQVNTLMSKAAKDQEAHASQLRRLRAELKHVGDQMLRGTTNLSLRGARCS
jgi:hypothetical protein